MTAVLKSYIQAIVKINQNCRFFPAYSFDFYIHFNQGGIIQ